RAVEMAAPSVPPFLRRDRRDNELAREEGAMWSGIARGLAIVALAFGLVAPAAADDFPSKPITFMVGLAPGGITDVTARLYAEVLARNTGQRVTIENRPAAAGALAAAAVQNAPRDGYTLLVFSGSQHATVAAMG